MVTVKQRKSEKFQPLRFFFRYDYVNTELLKLVNDNFSTSGKISVFGHSMGGHGALICYLKNPELYTTASAFAPVIPYLGGDFLSQRWLPYPLDPL